MAEAPADTRIDDRTAHAVDRIADIHALFARSDQETIKISDATTAISNAIYMILKEKGLSHDEAAAHMKSVLWGAKE